MTKFAIQSAITLVVSIVIVELIGVTAYAGIAAFIFLVALGLLYGRHGLVDNDESAPGWIWMSMTVGAALFVAAFWSVLVLAWSWHGAIARSRAAAVDDDDEPEAGDDMRSA